jgi:hypothetical protein
MVIVCNTGQQFGWSGALIRWNDSLLIKRLKTFFVQHLLGILFVVRDSDIYLPFICGFPGLWVVE